MGSLPNFPPLFLLSHNTSNEGRSRFLGSQLIVQLSDYHEDSAPSSSPRGYFYPSPVCWSSPSSVLISSSSEVDERRRRIAIWWRKGFERFVARE